MDTAPPRRGAHVLDAALRVIAEDGFAALSMRTVATAAGVSLAQVQYYFRSKDELLAAAFEHVSADVVARAEQVDTNGPTREVLRGLLHVWLPLDEERERAARVWLAFTAAAATSPTLGPSNAVLDADLRTGFAELLREAQTSGELPVDRDPDLEAALLLAVVDGLVVQSLALPAERRAALLVAALDTHLNRLFAPAVRRG
ncbi:TetR/AcrR family transcriptional regulator [Actinocatenispora comari]|uniref:HTH-type transcriptional regulator BetI n=1 Tax=Actinocatenispora comari TaxID=2807577 RepID=A0A8J4AD57_9ACTN|nr:TetR/AcrR family transcriptional regulator [Actinocatenispora comari]GIL27500.1 HTH-type transcriptional regulator BetI [Actinocatenispora comari]